MWVHCHTIAGWTAATGGQAVHALSTTEQPHGRRQSSCGRPYRGGTPWQWRVPEAPTTDSGPVWRTESRTGSPPLRSLRPYTQDRRRPMRLLPRVLVRLHAVEQPQHTLLAVSARAWRTEGGNAAGGTTACFPLSSSSPTWREGGLFHMAREAARIKKPQPGTVGVGTHAAAPFPRKDVSALCRAGLLARGIPLLSAPSQGKAPQWSLQISIRLQLRGSDGFTPSSLVTLAERDHNPGDDLYNGFRSLRESPTACQGF